MNDRPVPEVLKVIEASQRGDRRCGGRGHFRLARWIWLFHALVVAGQSDSPFAPPPLPPPLPPAAAALAPQPTPAPNWIAGRIVGADGTPLAGAEVTVQVQIDPFTRLDGPARAIAKTAEDGSFKTELRLPPGRTFRIAVRGAGAPAFATEALGAGTALPLRLVAPAREGWIAGRVVDARGGPLGHGRVDLYSEAGKPWIEVARAEVGRDGNFLIGPVAEDRYGLAHRLYDLDTTVTRATGLNTWSREETARHPVTLRSARAAPHYFSFRVTGAQGRSVERFRLDIEGRTKDGKPYHYGADVEPSAAEPGLRLVYDVAPGDYLALARTENASAKTVFRDDATSAGERAAIAMALEPRRPVTVNVVNADGAPGAGAEVVIYGATRPKPPELALPLNFRAPADARGEVVCGCLWAGPFNGCVAADADHENTFFQFTARADEPTRITVKRKGKTTPVVGGLVLDGAGRPLAGAAVTLSYAGCWLPGSETALIPGQLAMKAVTGADGRWRTRLIPCSFPMVKEKIFDLHLRHPDAGNASFYAVELEELLAQPVVVPPPGGVTLEFASENERGTMAVIDTFFLVRFIRATDPPRVVYTCLLKNWSGFKIQQSRHEIPPLERGVPLRVEAVSGGWICGEPLILENGREIGRGAFTLPALGRANWVVRVPVKRAPGIQAERGFPLEFLFRDADTGAPVAGAGAGDRYFMDQDMGRGAVSGPDGRLTNNMFFWDGCIHLRAPYRPVSSSLGVVIEEGGWAKIKLPEKSIYPARQPPVEVQVRKKPGMY